MRPCIPQSLGSPNQGLKAVIFEGRYSKLILAMKKKVIQMVRKRSCYCDTKLASHEGRLLNIVRADNLYEISTLYNEMPKLRVRSSLNNFVTLPFVQPRSIPHNGHLGQLTLLPFLSQLLVFMSANKTQKKNFHANCKVIPGSPDWLSDYSWPALNRTLGGRLFKPTPPGAVCHPDQPTFNAAIFPTV